MTGKKASQPSNSCVEMERETRFELATFCWGGPELVSVVGRAWMGERIDESHGVVTIDESVRGFVAAKIAIEPTVSISTRSNDAPRISLSPS